MYSAIVEIHLRHLESPCGKKNNWLHSESISVRNGLFQGRSQWGEEEGGWLKTNFVLKKKT